MPGMKRVKEEIWLTFHRALLSLEGLFLFLVNFNIDLSLNIVASHKKCQRFLSGVYFEIPLDKNN